MLEVIMWLLLQFGYTDAEARDLVGATKPVDETIQPYVGGGGDWP